MKRWGWIVLAVVLVGCGGGGGRGYTEDTKRSPLTVTATPAEVHRGGMVTIGVFEKNIYGQPYLGPQGAVVVVTFPQAWNEQAAGFTVGKDLLPVSCTITVPTTCPLGDYTVTARLTFDAGIQNGQHVRYDQLGSVTVRVIN